MRKQMALNKTSKELLKDIYIKRQFGLSQMRLERFEGEQKLKGRSRMFYDTLNTEDQVSYLIKPIIEVLQEVGGQLKRTEIRDRISEKDEKIAEFEQNIYF